MHRRQVVVTTGAALFGAGCVQTSGGSADPSPDTVRNRESPGETATDDSGRPDCTVPALVVHNDRSEAATVAIRLLDGLGRHRKGSPTPTVGSPTPTPDVTFSDTVTLGPDGRHEYETLPDARGTQRLEVSVAGGPNGMDLVQPREWRETGIVLVDIDSGEVEFSPVQAGLSTECA